MAHQTAEHLDEELNVDALALRAGIPTRTIREYQTMGLLPPPERRGRIGVYRLAHLRRLELIGRLQGRGYSLAGIRDLLASWHDGRDLTDILGLSRDDLVHVDEPGAPATLAQLSEIVPELVPEHLHLAMEAGLVDECGPNRFCIPSPSLLQLAVDALTAGYSADQVLELVSTIGRAAELVATAADRLLARPPDGADGAALAQLATRGRGLLASGTGRMAIYRLGKLLEADGHGPHGGAFR